MSSLALAMLIMSTGASCPTWPQIEESLRGRVCVARADDGTSTFAWSPGGCTAQGVTETPADAWLDQALADSGSLLVSATLLVDATARDSRGEDVDVRDLLLDREEVRRVILPRVRRALESIGCPIEMLPRESEPQKRTIAWKEFAPYLQAFLWPEDVRALHSGDRPGPRFEYSYYTCLSLNGREFLRTRDPELERAGFVVAMDSSQIYHAFGEAFTALLDDPYLKSLENPRERTAFLRGVAPREVTRRQDVQQAACETLRRYRSELALSIQECTHTDSIGAPTRESGHDESEATASRE